MAEETKKEEQVEEEQTEETPEAPAADEKTEDASDTPAEDSTPAEEVEVPEQFKKLIEEIEQMSVLELHELVKTLEKKFGVSAAAVAVAPGAGGGDAGAEEQSEFTIALTSAGDAKIQVIKVVKEVLGLGLKEAKDLVDGAPADLKSGVAKEEAEEIKGKIEEAGGTVELK